jgi:hypothetical protein
MMYDPNYHRDKALEKEFYLYAIAETKQFTTSEKENLKKMLNGSADDNQLAVTIINNYLIKQHKHELANMSSMQRGRNH